MTASNRIVSLDILRGMALMGMILVHFHQKMESEATTRLEDLIGWVVWMGVETKAWATFAFLFGAGFAVLMRRLEAKGRPVIAIFLRRMFVLAVIGLLVLVFSGFTILIDYAIWGVVLLLVRNWRMRSLLALAFVAAIASTVTGVVRSAVVTSRLGPERAAVETQARRERNAERWTQLRAAETNGSYSQAIRARLSHARWQYLRRDALVPSSNLVLFILGLLAIRHGIFDDPRSRRRVITIAMVFGSASWVAAWWVLPKLPQSTPLAGVTVPLGNGFGIVSDQWLALTYIGAVVLLIAYVPKVVRHLSPFGITGRMALTNYVAQAALISWLASGYGLSLEVRPYIVILATVILSGALAAFSAFWLARYRYGPLEWLWRSMTYLELQPARNRSNGSDRIGSADATTIE